MKTIQNLQLINETDPQYLSYQSSFKKSDSTIKNTERSKSEMIAYVLELTTREWIKKSGFTFDKRIISYTRPSHNDNKLTTFFDEIDYVIKKGNSITIGEVKVSYHNNGLKSKATEQLKRKGEYLKRLGYQVKYQMIFFDLAYSHSKSAFNKFDSNFKKVIFSLFENQGIEIEYLHLSPKEIYEWGVSEKIIKTPELLNAALEEAEKRYLAIEEKKLIKNHQPLKLPITIKKFSKSTQGLCCKSETDPSESDIRKVILSLDSINFKKDTIVIARFNWLKRNKFTIPDSDKLMNLCVQIQRETVRRAFYSENMKNLMLKLNYNILILN